MNKPKLITVWICSSRLYLYHAIMFLPDLILTYLCQVYVTSEIKKTFKKLISHD